MTHLEPPAFNSGRAVPVLRPRDGRGLRIRFIDDAKRYVLATSDTYIGSSGSPAFDDASRLWGLLVAGRGDFAPDTSDCNRSHRIADAGATGEMLADPRAALAAVCGNGFPDVGLCSIEPR